LSKTTETPEAEGQSQTIHYGWDGDRLVHVEDARQIRHTVYESGSFVPMLQLQRRKGAKNIAQITMGEEALSHLAPAQQEQMQAALKKALKTFDPQTASGLPQSAQSAMNTGWGPEMNQLVRQGFESLQAAQAEEEAKYPIEVRHILCDHLGTPMALIDATGEHAGQIIWAARYGAWGDIEAEYNPHQIEQPIRFQGQQFDEESGLHYNRFRYYDPALGRYITQDPIGLNGGANTYSYAKNPIQLLDPFGLNTMVMGGIAGGAVGGPPGAVVGAIIGGVVLLGGLILMSTNQNAQSAPARTAAEEVLAQSEYEAYKDRCEKKPDDNLSQCSKALFNKSRWEDCARMRQEWDNRWHPGRHSNDIANALNSVQKAVKDIAKYCRPSTS
jgi:RHS repeat-associated protein